MRSPYNRRSSRYPCRGTWGSKVLWLGWACLLVAGQIAPATAAARAAEPVEAGSATRSGDAGQDGTEEQRGRDARAIRLHGAVSREYDDNVDNSSPREQKGDFIMLQSLSLTALSPL